MALITTGKGLIRDLERSGALAVYVPLEGGFEGRYRRRLRAAGFYSISMTARGLGDLPAYLTQVHGVRPSHLGKKDIRVYYSPPLLDYYLGQIPDDAKGMVLWLLEGILLNQEELGYLIQLPRLEPRVKVIIEMGGARAFRWQPLKDLLNLSKV